jgi:hypothetical protein
MLLVGLFTLKMVLNQNNGSYIGNLNYIFIMCAELILLVTYNDLSKELQGNCPVTNCCTLFGHSTVQYLSEALHENGGYKTQIYHLSVQ